MKHILKGSRLLCLVSKGHELCTIVCLMSLFQGVMQQKQWTYHRASWLWVACVNNSSYFLILNWLLFKPSTLKEMNNHGQRINFRFRKSSLNNLSLGIDFHCCWRSFYESISSSSLAPSPSPSLFFSLLCVTLCQYATIKYFLRCLTNRSMYSSMDRWYIFLLMTATHTGSFLREWLISCREKLLCRLMKSCQFNID